MFDYRKILKAYIQHIKDWEATDYLGVTAITKTTLSDNLTSEELDELVRISDEYV